MALHRVQRASQEYEHWLSVAAGSDDWWSEVEQAEKQLEEACKALAALPDCSE